MQLNCPTTSPFPPWSLPILYSFGLQSWSWLKTVWTLIIRQNVSMPLSVTRCFCGYLTNFFEKMPKIAIFWRKMCKSITIFGNSARNRKSAIFCSGQSYQITAIPDMNIFCEILAIFGFFSKNLGGNVSFLSRNLPNCDILAIWAMHVFVVPKTKYLLSTY